MEGSYTFDRPDYQALEKFIKGNKGKAKIKYLIVFDHDRFSRNLPEALQKIESLEKRYGLKVIATSEPLDIDTQDPSVFLLRAFKYLIANQELLTIRRRAKVSSRHAQESGRYINLAPYGYVNHKEQGGKMIIKIDPIKQPIVQKIYRDFLSGVPKFIILKEVKVLGFPHSGNSAIHRILINPLYAGLVRVSPGVNMPEKIVKGIHEGMVTESQYYRVQEKLGLNKRTMQSKPKEEFPLKGILKSPCCDTNMTAGWCKGKKNYYLYYRCVKHSNVNISGQKLHDTFEEVLKHLSFTQESINKVINRITGVAKSTLEISEQRKTIFNKLLKAIDTKIETLETKLFEGTIIDHTYKRWMVKYEGEKAKLREKYDFSLQLEDDLHNELHLLPYMLNMPKIFQNSSLGQKHAILNQVFKQGLTYKEGSFRTPEINVEFVHKLLILKEKGLLFLEQPFDDFEGNPSCGERGIRTPGPVTVNSFQDCRIRPLCQLSAAKVRS